MEDKTISISYHGRFFEVPLEDYNVLMHNQDSAPVRKGIANRGANPVLGCGLCDYWHINPVVEAFKTGKTVFASVEGRPGVFVEGCS